MKKRFLSLCLACLMVMPFVVPASAANVDTHATSVAGGMSHTIALKEDGTVYAWGDNKQGQLGLGQTVTQKDKPEKIPGLTSITAVAAGYHFSLALRYNGTVVAWGNGTVYSPTDVAGVSNVVAIAAGQLNCLALTADGNVYQWNFGEWPTQVSGLQGIVAIAAGGNHNLALTRTGEVWSWGENRDGQLGTGTTSNEIQQPKKISELQDIVDIAAGVNHSLAVDFSGNVYAWGNDDNYQLGTQNAKGNNLKPMLVPNIKKAAQVAAGNGSSMAFTTDGRVYAWGYGEYGQLGMSKAEIAKAEPTQVSRIGNGTPDSIACGAYHNLCVNSNGSLYAWGRNRDGQLGTGRTENSNTPTSITSQIMVSTSYESCVLAGVSDWARSEIAEFYPKGLIPPTMMGGLQSAVTRAELAHLLVTVYENAKTSTTAPTRNPFNDIDGQPLKESILKAYNLGIINGTSEKTFSPAGQVTRQEAVTMLCRFVSKMKGTRIPTTVKNLSYYKDAASIAEWAAPYVDYAYNNSIMTGSGGNFSPLGQFTKEQSLLTVARLANANNWTAK